MLDAKLHNYNSSCSIIRMNVSRYEEHLWKFSVQKTSKKTLSHCRFYDAYMHQRGSGALGCITHQPATKMLDAFKYFLRPASYTTRVF